MSKNPLQNVRTETHHGVVVPVGKSTSLENVANESLETQCLETYEGPKLELHGKNNLQAAIATLITDAANGEPNARTELLDRVLGKPTQKQIIDSRNVTLIGFLDQIRSTEVVKEEDEPIVLE